jgi:hypothetical protein
VLDWARGTVRSAIGAAEHVEADVETRSPSEIEAKLDEMIAALHRAADSAERHVDVVEGFFHRHRHPGSEGPGGAGPGPGPLS